MIRSVLRNVVHTNELRSTIPVEIYCVFNGAVTERIPNDARRGRDGTLADGETFHGGFGTNKLIEIVSKLFGIVSAKKESISEVPEKDAVRVIRTLLEQLRENPDSFPGAFIFFSNCK